ncbi:MAG: PHP domain-containing protein [Candidatus Aenigmarchaeota archaeon]|nr:PHP domain-containing protein [Candidatus Aenigmarchaeota archaeon]
MRLELHCHSKYSRGKKIPTEGIDSPGDIVKAAKKLGLGGIALTDHSTNKGWKEAKEEAKKLGLIFIPAIEIASREGHIIGLGLSEHIQSGLSVGETVDKIHEQGALAIASHPFDVRREGLGKSSGKADVIEAFNSMNLDRFSNWAAKRFAKKISKPCVAGSDSHTKEMLGTCINYVEAHDMDSCLRQIKAGRVSYKADYIPLEKLLPWVKQRFALSYPDVMAYMERNYWQPKRWASERLVHKFMNDRNERFWYWIGELGIAGARGYGLARAIF